jgi:uncharacterized protein (TIGR03790 family)
MDDTNSTQVAMYYARLRSVPADNVVGIHIPSLDVLPPESLAPLREALLRALPASVESLLLVWSKPFAVGCMSVTTAFAAGYDPRFCQASCSRTTLNPLFDSVGWLPADTMGWYPAMLLPSDDVGLAHEVIRRGIASDASMPPGTLYLVRTSDTQRNVRASTYTLVKLLMANRLHVAERQTPILDDVSDAIGYFTGATQVVELPRIHFLPGALADHLTSSGGVLDGRDQMPALAWLKQGAIASYGTVTEPCSFPEKFPNIGVLFEDYRHGETALEAYWKSVEMPGQGLFIGEPLARPYSKSTR